MKYIENQFCYKANGEIRYGFFNIYQARHGGIMLCMGTKATALTEKQVNELPIDVYALEDFDLDAYKAFYAKSLPVTP